MLRQLVYGFALMVASAPACAADPVLQFSAGSLRGAMVEIAGAFQKEHGTAVTQRFGASGLLREAITRGEKAELFTSANMGHPLSLAKAGMAGPVVMFARNEMCAFVKPGLEVTQASLLERMLDPAIRLATSTPVADPSGDYAFKVFARAESLKPSAKAALGAKALQLVGGPVSPPTPADRNGYGHLISEGKADIFIAYCTNTQPIAREQPGIRALPLPEALAVGADYGMSVLQNASPMAGRLAMFILSGEGQAILKKHGFTAPTLPVE